MGFSEAWSNSKIKFLYSKKRALVRFLHCIQLCLPRGGVVAEWLKRQRSGVQNTVSKWEFSIKALL